MTALVSASCGNESIGNPLHFSLEVPRRAHQLLRDSDGTHLPLKATFLLSVSMSIVILPIERILKYRRNPADVHMNDAVLNPKLAGAVDRVVNTSLKAQKTLAR